MATLSNGEIDAIERDLGITLPGLYRRLLFEIGPGEFGEVAIYHPSEVRELYEPFFDDPRQLFNPYFPFGCHNRKQELWVIDGAAEAAASIWHETVPDDWSEEQWLTYEKWIERYLEPESGSFGGRSVAI
jgi:hypothetical protein